MQGRKERKRKINGETDRQADRKGQTERETETETFLFILKNVSLDM